MASLLKKLVFAVVAASLVGCGGSSVSNPAYVRFFNGFTDRKDVRVYLGTELYDAPATDPNVSFANDLSYGRSPSGSVTINVNPYSDLTTSWATLTNQALIRGLSYTVVGTTASGTRALYLFEDGVAPVSNTAFVRVINAAGVLTPLYFTLRQASDNIVVYQTGTNGQAVGTSSGYRSVAVTTTDQVSYLLNVYSTSGLTNPVSDSIPVTLQQGRPVTVVLYNTADGRVRAKSGIDVRGL